MICIVSSAAIFGVKPYVVSIEVDISSGMPYFNMVGLLSSEVREAKERVRAALHNSGEKIPDKRITINLSPAGKRKEGTGFDFPIAAGILCAMGRINAKDLEKSLIIGELGLDGDVKRINGILPIIQMAKENGMNKCFIPYENMNEGKIVPDIEIIPVKSLVEFISYISGDSSITPIMKSNYIENFANKTDKDNKYNFNQVYGQELVKRVLCISVAGRHNVLMIGPPGVGKSMLASRIPSIMPDMSIEECLEVSNIQSICGMLISDGLVKKRPFCAPHHSITVSALVGGGNIAKPGEITIAHNGVLFLDELPEFSPYVIDSLRQPLEEKCVKIHRNSGNYVFPADFLLIGAMNPCRCGYFPDRNKCNCSEADIKNYLNRISGPLLDRMDISIEVPRVKIEDLELSEIKQLRIAENRTDILSSEMMKKDVEHAVKRQIERQGKVYNAQLSGSDIRKYCLLTKECYDFMHDAYRSFELSMRSYYKIIKVARTIADIEDQDSITINHLIEALAYRTVDQKYFK